MSTEASGTVALAANWLEPVAQGVMSHADASVGTSLTSTCLGDWQGNSISTIYNSMHCGSWWNWPWPYYQPYYVPVTTYVTATEKIRLKSSEVERLRAAAKRDAKLKKVLQKFTPLIEVELEF